MGGGPAMRAAGKLAGVVNGSFQGGIRAVPLPEHLSSGASMARPITGVAAIEQMPRLVFGGAPTLQEAKDATFQLRTALDEAFLSNESNGGPYVSYPEHHLETKACVTSNNNALAQNNAFQAFRLLNESTAAQTVVASIASDPNVWTAVMQNDALVEFIHSQKTGAEFSGYYFPKHSDNEIFDEETGHKNDFNNFLKDMKVKLEQMMNSLSGFFQNLLVGPGAVDGSAKATSVDKAMGTSIMGLVIMVIMVVILGRG